MSGRKDRGGGGGTYGMGVKSGWVPASDDPTGAGDRALPLGTRSADAVAGAVPRRSLASLTTAAGDVQAVRFTKATDAIQGATLVHGCSPTKITLTGISFYRTADGVPRRATVYVAPGPVYQGSGTSFGTVLGLWCKVTWGTERGAITRWIGAPFELPIEGSYVKVEAFVTQLPYVLAAGGNPTGSIIDTSNFSSRVQCLVIDGWTDPGPPTQLAKEVACGSTGPQLALAGVQPGGYPAIIDLITLTNTNATGQVRIWISDAITSSPTFQTRSVYVPAGITVSIGADMLGGFMMGVWLAAVGDATDANVFASIWGRALLPSGAGS